jgi:hypothetical protein
MTSNVVRMAVTVGCILCSFPVGAAENDLRIGLFVQHGGPEKVFFVPVAPPVQLATNISRVSVANVEDFPVGYYEDGILKEKSALYYFVQIELDRLGYQKLLDLTRAQEQYQGPATLIFHLFLPDQVGEAHFSLDSSSEKAAINLVLQEEAFQDVVRLVRKDWREKHKSVVQKWEDGELK